MKSFYIIPTVYTYSIRNQYKSEFKTIQKKSVKLLFPPSLWFFF